MVRTNGNVRYLAIFSDMMKKYQENCKNSLGEYSFTPNETSMMICLLKNPEVDTAKDIAKRMGISQSLICRSVDSLTRKGFLKVIRDNDDRRINHLTLKIEDQNLKNILLSMDNSFEDIMVDGVADDELATFHKVVARMAQNVGVAAS
jgi:DNA-binding MarR family transcriptional regulator